MKIRKWHIGVLVLLLVVSGCFLVADLRPSLAAQGADVLRSILGVRVTAKLETILFQTQDAIRGLEYRLGLKPAAAPWQEVSGPFVTPLSPASGISPFIPTPSLSVTAPPPVGIVPTVTGPRTSQIPLPTPTSQPAQAGWLPAPVKSPGNLPGAGVWQPYLFDPRGEVIGYRTFIQPDTQRPYVVAAVVAFDLARTQLHFVLGTEEPYSANKSKRPGVIPQGDRIPGLLVAAFNGGFKAIHGHYGAMSGGVEPIPPRDGLGTVAIYKDGSLRIGEWGRDIVYDPSMVSFRQNCPLLLDGGAINPLVNTGTIADWGGNLDGAVVTFRSAIGISRDNQVLYYLAGPHLSMPVLAGALVSIGSYQAMQLDINNFYVHFTAIHTDGENLAAEPLMPEFMSDNVNRYLGAFFRDYFYVTVRGATLP